jgi:hypothetical protein
VTERVERRLTAILAADVAGYSRLAPAPRISWMIWKVRSITLGASPSEGSSNMINFGRDIRARPSG